MAKEKTIMFTKGTQTKYYSEKWLSQKWKNIGKTNREIIESKGWKEGVNSQTKLVGAKIQKVEEKKPIPNESTQQQAEVNLNNS